VAASVVATSADVLSDAQLRHRRSFHELDIAAFGPLPFARSPISLDGETGEPAPAHALGQDNDAVFLGVLGLDPDEYRHLVAEGVIT
jgi:crotonobetainyl-CoA:carnitine CoA-transferase CaiB-like acyl-CoA transferase